MFKTMKVSKLLCIAILLTSNQLLAQSEGIDLPKTNIVMMDMDYNNGLFDFYNPKIVAGEKDRYENQPRFTTDGDYVLFSKEYRSKKRKHTSVTTDICTYKVNGGKTRRLTKTAEYEFSPQESDYRQAVTAVQLNADEEQFIVKYNEDGEFERNEKLNGETVGYYSWLNDQNILIYSLPEPATLKWVNLLTGEEHLISSKIGRTIEYCKRDNGIYWVDKSDENWSIKRVLLEDMEASPETIIELRPGVEDFTMLNDGSIISHYKGKLYHFAPGKMGEYNGHEMENWELIADLDRLNMPTQITRITVSPENDAMVVVVDEDDEWFSRNKK